MPPSRLCGSFFPAGLHGRPEGQGPTQWLWGRALGQLSQGDGGAGEGEQAVPVCEHRPRSAQGGGAPGLGAGLAPPGRSDGAPGLGLGAWWPGAHGVCVPAWDLGRDAQSQTLPLGVLPCPPAPASAGHPAWRAALPATCLSGSRAALGQPWVPPEEQPAPGSGVAPQTIPSAVEPKVIQRLPGEQHRGRQEPPRRDWTWGEQRPGGWGAPISLLDPPRSAGPCPPHHHLAGGPPQPPPRAAAQLLTYFGKRHRGGPAALLRADPLRRELRARGRVSMLRGRGREPARGLINRLQDRSPTGAAGSARGDESEPGPQTFRDSQQAASRTRLGDCQPPLRLLGGRATAGGRGPAGKQEP